VNRPLDISDVEYEAALWRATDASLRRDPERWVFASALALSFSTASRGGAGDPHETGLRAYVPDERARAAVRAAGYRENARREKARRGWETRRAQAQPPAPARPELG
jgi:hypothetical protein